MDLVLVTLYKNTFNLSEPQTNFIFSIISDEFDIIGILLYVYYL